MNPALPSPRFKLLPLLALLSLGVACNPVDPDEALAGLTTRCVHQDSCAPGFTCESGKCVLRGGESCREGFDFASCDKTQGVCAGVRRACVDGVVEKACSTASYGPDYEAVEARCDGLDNDCDGNVDAWPVEVLSFFERAQLPPPAPPVQYRYESAETRLVPFGSGFLGVVASTITTSYQSQEPPLAPDYSSTVRFQPLDAQLQPASPAAVVLHTGDGWLSNLQVVPFDGGVFLLWTGQKQTSEGGQTLYTSESFLARIDVGASAASPSVGIAPRAPPVGYPGAPLRGAVSRDGQRLLLGHGGGQVRAQLFSLDLEPLTEERVLNVPHPEDVSGSYLSHMDVAANGAAGYTLAWALLPPSAQGSSEPSRVQLRFQRFSSALEPQGAVVGTAGEAGYVQDLRVLGDAQSDDAIFAAWQVIPPYVANKPSLPTLGYAWPFAAGLPSGEPTTVDVGAGRVLADRDGSGEVVLGLSRPGEAVTLRRFDAARVAREQVLPLPPGNPVQGIAVFDSGEGERWRVGFSTFDGTPRALTLCR